MYHRDIPNGTSYARVVEDAPPRSVQAPAGAHRSRQGPPPPRENAQGRAAPWLSSLLKRLQLEDLDTGDILLLLILLFLFIDGDDLELLITLALLILLGLGKKEKEPSD